MTSFRSEEAAAAAPKAAVMRVSRSSQWMLLAQGSTKLQLEDPQSKNENVTNKLAMGLASKLAEHKTNTRDSQGMHCKK